MATDTSIVNSGTTSTEPLSSSVQSVPLKSSSSSLKSWVLRHLNSSEQVPGLGAGQAGQRWAQPRAVTDTMTVDIEKQRQPLVKNTEKMPQWVDVLRIIRKDDSQELQRLLEQESMELVLRPHDSQHYKTSLHAAVESAAMDCLQRLLKANPTQEILDLPDIDGNTALHAAVKKLNVQAVKELLSAGVNPNVRNDQGHSCLHLLAYEANTATTSDKLTGVMKCTDLLLGCTNIDLEALNNSKITPLRAAASKLPCKASSLDEFCRKLVNNGAFVDDKTREKLDKHCIPKITAPAGAQSRERPPFAQIFDFLILNTPENIRDVMTGQGTKESRDAANWYMGSKKILYYLVDKCNEEGVRTLLEMKADPWSSNIDGELPLHRALARGHFPIVNILIEKMKTNSRTLDLRYASFSLLQKALETSQRSEEDSIKCLGRLFENDVMLDVNQKEEGTINQTALHIAGAMNNQEAMAILLQHGAYLGEHRIINRQDNGTVLNALMAKTLNKSMDNCIMVPSNTAENHEDDLLDPDYTLEMSYKFLLPPLSEQTTKIPQLHNEAAVLFDVSQSKEHRNAIKHPLIQTLLYAKWRRVLPLYILNLILYLIFVILLTVFMYALKNVRILQNMDQSGNYTVAPEILQQQIQHYQTTRGVSLVFVLLITLYMAVKEIFQIIFTYKSYYRYIENYLEWFLILAVLIAAVAPLSVDATRHLAAWAMIAAWYEFVLVLGRAPPLAIYITMLRHVSWNFLKLVFLFGFLIIAFSISFNIILQPGGNLQSGAEFTDFAAFWTTLPRAIVMATGEFEYSNISEELSGSALFATSTVLIFLVFLFLIFLVLMNVMTGLAVTDAKEIVEDAILYSLKSRLELVYLNEQLFIKVPFLHKLLPYLQLLANKQRRLLVRMNKLPKTNRILYGEDGHEDLTCKLDNRTAEVLRNHRLHQLAEAKAERQGNPTEQILQILNEMRSQAVAATNP